ncbi:acyl-CoA N-acyltransferase [Mycena sp. CBHHK59/15]|nr:acyl-CoA N-acyltransferase [Mycena sp. CBHHK59/15]
MSTSLEKAPVPIIVPRPTNDIVVRQFRPEDAEQIHTMLVEGLVYGHDSPCNTARQRYLFRPVSYAAYTAIALGALLFAHTLPAVPNATLKAVGALLALSGAALILYIRSSATAGFLAFCATARATDMADINASYGVPRLGEPPETQGPAGFWVAAIGTEVVGYLGLDYTASPDPASGELRRMIVSTRHRRRGIGTLLIAAAVAHARTHSPPLRELDLETTEFQPGAQTLYAGMGWARIGERWIIMGKVVRVRVFRYRRRVDVE